MVTHDLANALITVKYKPGGVDMGDDQRYKQAVPVPSTKARMVCRFRRISDSDPAATLKAAVNRISSDKKWKCIAADGPQVSRDPDKWEESYTLVHNERGWPDGEAVYVNPQDNKVPPDVSLANIGATTSIGTSGNGVNRPSLFATYDFVTNLGMTFP
jgi:hypothetical protein